MTSRKAIHEHLGRCPKQWSKGSCQGDPYPENHHRKETDTTDATPTVNWTSISYPVSDMHLNSRQNKDLLLWSPPH